MSDLGQEHPTCMARPPVWHLALTSSRNSHFFATPRHENAQFRIFLLQDTFRSQKRDGEKRGFAINTFKKYEAISTTRWGVYWSSRLLSCNILSRKGLLGTLCQVQCAVMCVKYNGVLRKGCLCAVCCIVSSSRRSTIWGLHTPQGSPFTLFIGYEQYCLANKLQLKLFQTGPLKNKNFPSVLLFVIFFLLPSIPPTLNSLYLFL